MIIITVIKGKRMMTTTTMSCFVGIDADTLWSRDFFESLHPLKEIYKMEIGGNIRYSHVNKFYS